MNRIALLILAAVLSSCGQNVADVPSDLDRFAGLPSPSQLVASTPRTTSGSHAVLNRTLVAPGEAFSVLPGYSANADLGPDGDAILHGSTSALSYVMYEVSSDKLSDLATISQMGIDVRWDAAEPGVPESVFLGFPNHAEDRWLWFDTRELSGQQMYDISLEALHGLDPALGLSSYIAVVNFSSQDAHVDELRLRFTLPSTVEGDEYLYFTSRDPAATSPLATSVSRVDNLGGVPDILFEADLATPVVYLAPVVIDYLGGWRLLYTQDTLASPAESYMSDMEGNGSILAGNDAVNDVYAGGFNYGDNHGLILQFSPGFGAELWAVDSNLPPAFEYGRLSQAGDKIQTAVWDLSVDTSITEYAAIASVEVDSFDSRNGLVSYSGNSPFNIDALPIPIYIGPLPEDARDPFMVELANFFGDSEYWIYFACRGRDDATYNIYRINRVTLADPEPVVVDPAYELRYPSISPNGRYLAYMRAPAGSTFVDNSEVVVADLLDPTNEHVVASDGVAFQYWFDPTP